MLKFFVMINCDICGRTFENLAVSGITDPFIIDVITSDLERAAEESGWFYYHEEHRCTNCHQCLLQTTSEAARSLNRWTRT